MRKGVPSMGKILPNLWRNILSLSSRVLAPEREIVSQKIRHKISQRCRVTSQKSGVINKSTLWHKCCLTRLQLINALCIITTSVQTVNLFTRIYLEDPVAIFARMGPKFPFNTLYDVWNSLWNNPLASLFSSRRNTCVRILGFKPWETKIWSIDGIMPNTNSHETWN